MENREFHSGVFDTSFFKASNRGIEERLNFGYNILDRQNAIQNPGLLEEADDPPEAVLTTWGIWRRWRDPLHRIEEKYDIVDMIRAARAVDDIIHHLYYVPVIGNHENLPKSYKIDVEHDSSYALQEPIYAANIDFEEENINSVEITFNVKFDEDASNLENAEHNEAEHIKEEKLPAINELKNNYDFESKKSLMKIFEKIILERIIKRKNKA